MHETSDPEPAVIRLRLEAFEKHCAKRGLRTLGDRADFIGIHYTNLGRIIRGDVVPGEVFIAATLAAFGVRRFYELFEVVIDDDESAAA